MAHQKSLLNPYIDQVHFARQLGRYVESLDMGLRLYGHAEQVAAYLKQELLKGRWTNELPGADRLAAEFDVNHTTMGAAIRLLQDDGLLAFQGPGKPRKILSPKPGESPSMRIGILLYEKVEERVDYIVDLRHCLLEEGHIARFASRSLVDLKMSVERVAKHVEREQADAWIVQAGSRSVLEWFSEQSIPAVALAGRRHGVKIAGVGPDKVPAMQDAVSQMVKLGHRRIVLFERKERRHPHPGFMERAFLEALENHGIATSSYHLPAWEESAAGLCSSLRELFKVTPPSAMLISEARFYLAIERQLGRMGYHAPKDVSLACLDPSPSFDWFRPQVAHIRWDERPMIQRLIRWANQVARGKEDMGQAFTKAEFVMSGTVGPAPAGR